MSRCLLALIALTLPLSAQAPELVADVNQTGPPHDGVPLGIRDGFAEVGGKLVFLGDTAATGAELFTYTPSGAPTVLRDIWPGPAGSDPELGVVHGGLLYFVADDGESGREIWRTDGTLQGTRRFSDVFPGIVSSMPEQLLVDGGRLFATALDGTPGSLFRRLVSIDLQTGQPTFLTATVGFGFAREPSGLTPTGTGLYVFSAEQNIFGPRELFVTDGTVAGTMLLADIDDNTSTSSSPSQFTPFGGFVYFTATVDETRELWRTDGSVAGTTLVRALWPERTPTWDAGELVTNGQALVFPAYGLGVGMELWAITTGAPFVLTDLADPGEIPRPSHLVMHGDTVYFAYPAGQPSGKTHPWRATLTPNTERLLGDLDLPGYLGALNFVEHAGRVYFVASDGVSDVKLFSTDGTPAGTLPVTDAGPGLQGLRDLTSTSSGLYFSAESSALGRELYRHDGTSTSLVADLYPGSASSDATPTDLARVFARELYFTATNGITGRDPYRIDTAGALHAVANLDDPTNSGARGYTGAWDGARTQVFFSGSELATGYELFVEGDQGIQLVKDLRPGLAGSFPLELTAFAGELYFTATAELGKRELFKTDGTDAGTLQLVPTHPVFSGDVRDLVAGSEALYFRRTDGQGQRAVYSVLPDQTVTQIGPPNVFPGPEQIPVGLRMCDGRLVFLTFAVTNSEPRAFAYDERTAQLVEWPLPTGTHQLSSALEPVVHDGRYYFPLEVQGVQQKQELFSLDPWTGDLRRHHTTPAQAHFTQLTSTGGHVYYELDESFSGSSTGRIARCTDAVDSGEVLGVQEGFFEISQLTGLGDRAYFRVQDAGNQLQEDELLRSGPYDGASTLEVAGAGAVITPGGQLHHEEPSGVTVVGGDVIYAADPFGGPGRELFRLRTPEASVVDYDLPGSGGSLRVDTPNLGTTVELHGSIPVVGGLTAVVLGAPAAPYALPGAVATDAACVGPGSLQVVGVFTGATWSGQAAIPATPALAGAQFAIQGVTVDVLTPGAPLRLTNAKFLTLGL